MKTSQSNKNVLVIAYHFPPCAISSGIQRTLSFVRYLRNHGWNPVVLTVRASAYERTNPAQLSSIPDTVPVVRTWSLDAARHLSVRGRYWSQLTLPDRWKSWWLSAVPVGLRLIKQHNISVIWSTYPIATAHSIGNTLSRLSGIPWIADFRDPMVEYVARSDEHFPKDPALRAARLKIEALAAANATKLVFCTFAAKDIVKERYNHLRDDRVAVISNGYDEDAFKQAEALASPSRNSTRKILLHSGTIYLGADRDPSALFAAIRALAASGRISPENFELRLRDPSSPEKIQALINEYGIQRYVSIQPSLSYFEALNEMMQADGLLILQGHTSNPAVPAKLYEYLRARRPILGLVDACGATAQTLKKVGIPTAADITDTQAIQRLLLEWLTNPVAQLLGETGMVKQFSREQLTSSLATLLDSVSDSARR